MNKHFERLLGFVLLDEHVTDMRQRAYMLATVKHETDRRWYTKDPTDIYNTCEEIGMGRGKPYYPKFYGRGFVQLTWEENYRKFGDLLKIDLLNGPFQALEWETAYKIMSLGMSQGLFTGKKLSDYINDKKTDYVGARKIINGTDKAQLIAGYAGGFEIMLSGIARAA
jgi:hypothetical protein